MKRTTVAEFIQIHRSEIVQSWQDVITREVHELASMDPSALRNKWPEAVDALAGWMNGYTAEEADAAFVAMADGHALQRLGFGIDLAVVVTEYASLRRVVHERLFDSGLPAPDAAECVRLNAGIDRAIHFAVLRYTAHRDHVRDHFIGMLAHDLRNPLTAAHMAAEGLVHSDHLLGEDRSDVQTIVEATLRMSRMVEDILASARTHLVGGVPANPKPCDMAEICGAAAAEVQIAYPLRNVGSSCSGNMRGTFDRDRVFQALVNLLTNAVQHGEDPVRISGYEAEDGRAVFTQVSNGGKSMPAEVISKLLGSIVPAERHESGRQNGLGLGIVGQIARSHGATYTVTSSERQTSFIIRWPRAL